MTPEFSGRRLAKEFHSEYRGTTVEFEGIKIQWDKREWMFQHPELGNVVKPTLSLLNPAHWEELSDRLNRGETAAGMMMGNYGVFKKLDAPGSADALFDKVKQRSRDQNFVALIHPEDIMEFVDQTRLEEPYKTQLLQPEERLKFYAGPQHVVLPVKDDEVNSALVRQADKTISCFWVPEHFGFAGFVGASRRIMKKGSMLGGGSLNIHGQNPYYDKNSLYVAMAQQREWLEEIDFIVFDDIAEAGDIGRSHTMTRYVEGHAEIIRLGSISAKKVREVTGHDLTLDNENIRYASSKTLYSLEQDTMIDARVEDVLQRIQRFANSIKESP